MSDILFWIALAVVAVSALAGRMLVNVAVQYVKSEHPADYTELAASGRALIKALSQPDGRVRRVLAGRMLWGGLSTALAADPQIKRLQSHWRRLFAATVAGFVCLAVVIAMRLPAG